MTRNFAVSLGALAMGLVVLRGAIQRELIVAVAQEALLAMIVFAGIGAVAGWISDYLIRDAMERKFRSRVDWYRQGLVEAGYPVDDSPGEQ